MPRIQWLLGETQGFSFDLSLFDFICVYGKSALEGCLGRLRGRF